MILLTSAKGTYIPHFPSPMGTIIYFFYDSDYAFTKA